MLRMNDWLSNEKRAKQESLINLRVIRNVTNKNPSRK